MLYEPREDSRLLAKYVKKYAKGLVLDIGTGSGIQAVEAAKKKNVKKVVAVDIQKEVIDYCKENIKNKKIVFKQSDLFSNIKNIRFDTITFNPPYLPEDIKLKDLTIDGGKKGYEVIERCLDDVNDYLKPNGIILIVFSSLTKKEKVDEFIKNNLLKEKVLDKKHIFFEDLYAYLIEKSSLLKDLEKKKSKNIKYLTKGSRGILYTADYGSKKVVIKKKLPESKAIGRIGNEIGYLKILNKKGIGPTLLFSNKDYFVYEYIDGLFVLDFIENLANNKKSLKDIKNIIKNVFDQCFIMDKLMIDKEEMHHPLKHIIIQNKTLKPYLVDFERCHKTEKPKNVTQFSVFLISGHLKKLLEEKGINIDRSKIIELCKRYKKEQNKENLKLISNEIQ